MTSSGNFPEGGDDEVLRPELRVDTKFRAPAFFDRARGGAWISIWVINFVGQADLLSLVQVWLEQFTDLSPDPGRQTPVARVLLGSAVTLVDPFAFLVGLLLIEPDEAIVYDDASEPINFILLQELAVFADGAELHIVHPEQAADFEMLIDVMPVQGRERITMAPIDIREVEDFSYLKPRQRVIGRAENERHLLGWNPIRSR